MQATMRELTEQTAKVAVNFKSVTDLFRRGRPAAGKLPVAPAAGPPAASAAIPRPAAPPRRMGMGAPLAIGTGAIGAGGLAASSQIGTDNPYQAQAGENPLDSLQRQQQAMTARMGSLDPHIRDAAIGGDHSRLSALVNAKRTGDFSGLEAYATKIGDPKARSAFLAQVSQAQAAAAPKSNALTRTFAPWLLNPEDRRSLSSASTQLTGARTQAEQALPGMLDEARATAAAAPARIQQLEMLLNDPSTSPDVASAISQAIQAERMGHTSNQAAHSLATKARKLAVPIPNGALMPASAASAYGDSTRAMLPSFYGASMDALSRRPAGQPRSLVELGG